MGTLRGRLPKGRFYRLSVIYKTTVPFKKRIKWFVFLPSSHNISYLNACPQGMPEVAGICWFGFAGEFLYPHGISSATPSISPMLNIHFRCWPRKQEPAGDLRQLSAIKSLILGPERDYQKSANLPSFRKN